jgi:hypothetical protein
MFAKLAEGFGKFVGAVLAGLMTPLLVNVVVAQIKDCQTKPTVQTKATPTPAVILLAPVAAKTVAPSMAPTPSSESRQFVWRPAGDAYQPPR